MVDGSGNPAVPAYRTRLVAPGSWADITLFDPKKVQDTSQFNDPHHYPEGIPSVIVNGIPVIRNGEHTHAKAGKPLAHDGRPREDL